MATIKQLAVLTVFVTFVELYATASPGGRIVGGQNAANGQFPAQASLRLLYKGNFYHICGGSIISANTVVTAAHCVVATNSTQPHPADLLCIGAGSIDRREHVTRNVSKVTVHPSYNGNDFLNDLAVLILAAALPLGGYIQPIALPTQEVPDGKDVIISGWGLLLSNGTTVPFHLQYVIVKKISKLTCWLNILKYEDCLLCLDHPKGKGVCNGDSGGPAFYKNTLVGAAGFTVGGCGGRYPDGYANIYYHRKWIVSNMV